jgi:NitT/TauT family transport system permease protein
VLAGVVLAWQVLVRALGVPIVLVPAPTDVARALVAGLVDGSLPAQTWVTLQEILIGFGMAGVSGLVAALLVTQLRLVEKAFLPLIVLTQSVPKVAMAPLLLIWFGTGTTSKVVTTALIAFFPVLVNSVLGLRAAGRDHIDMLRSFGATRAQILLRLTLPTALPSIFAGLEVAVVLSVTGAIVAEFVGSSAGLGYVMQATNYTLDVATTFAVLVVLGVVGLALHGVIAVLSKRFVFWSAHDRGAADL